VIKPLRSSNDAGFFLEVLALEVPSIWLICSLTLFSNSASSWPRSAAIGGSLVALDSSLAHLLPKKPQIDCSRFMVKPFKMKAAAPAHNRYGGTYEGGAPGPNQPDRLKDKRAPVSLRSGKLAYRKA
jgi:hypothetical protein